MKTIKNIKAIFDNKGETLDRFTAIDKDGDMYGFSENGLGYNQYDGNCIDNYMFVSYGYGWRKTCNVTKIIKNELPRILSEFAVNENIGTLLPKKQWPKNIVNLYLNRVNEN